MAASESRTLAGSNATNAGRAWQPSGDSELIWDYLPRDESQQTSSLQEARRILRQWPDPEARLLDLGCGTGSSFEALSACGKRLHWIGVDIADSREARQRRREDLDFCTYDGIHVPIRSGVVDLVYSHQVFEHVRHPEKVLAEACRILKPSGCLIGSTSQLEPFHSRSYWNFTPYGFCTLLRGAGFDSISVRPGIDGVTLIGRRLFSYIGMARPFDFFLEHESPVNFALEWVGRMLALPAPRRNLLKLLFAGHFVFVARKGNQ